MLPPAVAGRPDTLAVAVGSALGTGARALVGLALPVAAGGWPWSTLAVNVLGSFVLGAALGLGDRGLGDRGRAPAWWHGPAFTAGAVGSFTTFSALAIELGALAPTVAIAYAAASLAAGLLAAALGWRVGRRPA